MQQLMNNTANATTAFRMDPALQKYNGTVTPFPSTYHHAPLSRAEEFRRLLQCPEATFSERSSNRGKERLRPTPDRQIAFRTSTARHLKNTPL
jgi:hypothetical protein